MSDTSNERWSINHQIPAALIFAIMLQTAGAFWWASKIDTTIQLLTERLEKHETLPRHHGQADADIEFSGRVTRLEVVVDQQTEVLREIRDLLAKNRDR